MAEVIESAIVLAGALATSLTFLLLNLKATSSTAVRFISFVLMLGCMGLSVWSLGTLVGAAYG